MPTHLGEPIDLTRPIEVYWNLHRGGWSVRQRGMVLAHLEHLELRDCSFVINERLRQAFDACPNRRTVHAWVRGYLVAQPARTLPIAVRYNPFHMRTFCRALDGAPVYKAARVLFHSDRRLEALHILTEHDQ